MHDIDPGLTKRRQQYRVEAASGDVSKCVFMKSLMMNRWPDNCSGMMKMMVSSKKEREEWWIDIMHVDDRRTVIKKPPWPDNCSGMMKMMVSSKKEREEWWIDELIRPIGERKFAGLLTTSSR